MRERDENPIKAMHQAVRAIRIADSLHSLIDHGAMAILPDQDRWEQAAKLAGLTSPPGEETKAIAIQVYRRLRDAVGWMDNCELCGKACSPTHGFLSRVCQPCAGAAGMFLLEVQACDRAANG